MRTIVLLLLLTSIAHADEDNTLFSFKVLNKYKNMTTSLIDQKKEIICKTEANPYFVIDPKFKKEDLFKEIEHIKKNAVTEKVAKGCPRQEVLILKVNKRTQFFCRENVRDFAEKMSKICGRNL